MATGGVRVRLDPARGTRALVNGITEGVGVRAIRLAGV
jgi:hypothetical protein